MWCREVQEVQNVVQGGAGRCRSCIMWCREVQKICTKSSIVFGAGRCRRCRHPSGWDKVGLTGISFLHETDIPR